MWYGSTALLFYDDLLRWLRVLHVVLSLLADPLPDIGGQGAPVLQLLIVQLVDTQVRLRVLLLPPDRIEVGAELRHAFQLDRGHLLLGVDNIVGHAEHVRRLLLVVPEVNDPGPPQAFEVELYILVIHGFRLYYFGDVYIFLRLQALILAQQGRPQIRDFLQHL